MPALANCLGLGRPIAVGSASIDQTNLLIETPFDEGSGIALRNLITPDVANFFALPEGPFPAPGNNPWGTGGGTFAGGSTDPDGGTRAWRVSNLEDWFGQSQLPLVEGQQYTLSISVKSNTGSSQNFRFVRNGGFSGNLTATTSWQRFSVTFTCNDTPTQTVGILGWDGTNTLDVLFYGPKLELGAVATAYVPATGNLRMKGGAVQWTSDGVNFAGVGQRWGADNITARSFAAVSLYALIKWPIANAPQDAGYVPIIGTVNDDVSQVFLSAGGGWSASSHFPCARFRDTILKAIGAVINDDLWHLVCFTYDGSFLRYYVDALEVARLSASALSAVTVKQFYVSNFTGFCFPGTIAYLLVYDVAHAAAAVRAQFAGVAAAVNARGITLAVPDLFIAPEGDSITQGTGNKPYAPIAALDFPRAQTHVFAVPGDTIVEVAGRASEVDALLPATATPVLSILIGRNDFGGTSASALVASIKSYCQARQAAGWLVVVCTLLPGIGAGYNTFRNAVNVLLRADSSFYDAICDFGADPVMGPDGAENDTALYSDGVHPTQTGQNNLAVDFSDTLDGLLT